MRVDLTVNGSIVEPIRVGGRLEYRFHSGENLQYVSLNNNSFLKDFMLSEMQLERSSISTPFVEPMQSETVASGLFKTVQGISYEITSPESDTWAEIRQSVEGSITTYHNGTLQSTIGHTIEDIIFGIRDIAKGDQASFNLRLDGIQQTVKNEMYQSVQTNLAHFVGLQLTDIEGNINTIQSTVQGTIQHISDVEGNVNALQSTVDGTVQHISDVEGNLNTLQSTVDGTIQDISNLEGDYNSISNTVNSHSQIIGTNGGNISQLVLSSELFQTSVIDEINDTKSSITQLSDTIGLRTSGGQIVIGGSGIIIDAKSIFLGSSTQIADGIITDKMISPYAAIDAAKITNLTVSNAQIISLDVSKISGNTANFTRANFNSSQSQIVLDSTGLRAIANLTTTITAETRFSADGLEFHSNGKWMGLIHANWDIPKQRGVMTIAPFYNHDLILAHGGTPAEPKLNSAAITIPGEGGVTSIHYGVHTPRLYAEPGASNYLRFYRGTITSQGNGFFLRNYTSDAGIWFGDNGHVWIRSSSGGWKDLSV